MQKKFNGSYPMTLGLLKSEFEKYRSEYKTNLKKHELFELFTSELIFKKLGLREDVTDGLAPSGKKDGGVDRAFFVLNETQIINQESELLTEDNSLFLKTITGVKNTIDIIIIQAKEEETWESSFFSKMRQTLPLLLDINLNHDTIPPNILSESALEINTLWQKIHKIFSDASIYPAYRVHVYYTSLADDNLVGPELENSKELLKNDLSDKFVDGTEFYIDTFGTYQLWDFFKLPDELDAIIQFDGQSIRVDEAFLGLVKISDYLDFISLNTDKTKIRNELFARNIRTFAGTGKNKVNGNILKTLSLSEGPDFWWLNNGITIVADKKVDIDGKRWKLINPSVVNGLQTSYSIFEKYNSSESISERMMNSSLMVRVVVSDDRQIQEKIIGCTNSQTAIDSEYIHANDEIQKKIESILRSYGWDYERRAYQYRNQKNKITMKQLVQAVNSYYFLDPYQSRNQPARLMTEAMWSKIFSSSHDEELYLQSIIVLKAVESYLSHIEDDNRDTPSNLRYYLISAYVLKNSGVKRIDDFRKVPITQLAWGRLLDDKKNIVSMDILEKEFGDLVKLISKTADELNIGDKQDRNPLFKNSRLQQKIFERIVNSN